MSTGQISRHRSRSQASKHPLPTKHTPPPQTLTPENTEQDFEPCAATASFVLYAQRNLILVLHHDTLAIERRFDLHREDVIWIQVDNTSDRGSGRLAVSYDAGSTSIVWDILTGGEVARFTSYEHMRHASFMRNGNIAFGNDQGNIILFEPSTSEHISARTIFDPITAIAPSNDCRTFAIGYLNGSILVATLQPSFTILHTLTTNKSPSRITGVAWHGSSSRQRTDMLATQTADGDLRVWSVPKAPHHDAPTIIRVLQRGDVQAPGPCWFAWSKNGRIVQHAEGETRSWDVRTKKVTYEVIPTIDGVTGMANYGPTATLFTLGRNHTVQQYEITPDQQPLQVHGVQHMPAITPPTPPTTLEDPYGRSAGEPMTAVSGGAPMLPTLSDVDTSADEGGPLSPLQKIAHEIDSLDALESELRDQVMPLSPGSSRASSVSSMSSRGSRRARKYLYDKPGSSRASNSTGFDGTEFSFGDNVRAAPRHESMSIRTESSFASRASRPFHQKRTSNLRQELPRSPEESQQKSTMDLFPCLRARLRDVSFRTPHYGQSVRTPELLQREMLSTVFGWHDDIQSLVEDELSRHQPGSASGVLLSKWLGDVGADSMASMVGSESMTSSDWMLLALSAIGKDSQKKVGEAFVQRLLEKGDVHPAVAILLGLGEFNDAIEVYVSLAYWMEAVLLTCLTCQSDWSRQSYLIRKWGEAAVQQGQAELAVRCFSCTSIETTEPWFSPRAQQDVAYAAQQQILTAPLSAGPQSPPLSPPSVTGSDRIRAKNASLKLITSFGAKGIPLSVNQVAATPIESALSPGGDSWRQQPRTFRDPSSARTATPGGYIRRKRLPSRSDIERAKAEAADMSTPITAARELTQPPSKRAGHSRRTSTSTSESLPEPSTAVHRSLTSLTAPDEDRLPSPNVGVFDKLREQSKHEVSHGRKPSSLASIHVIESKYDGSRSPAPSVGKPGSIYTSTSKRSRQGALSPPLTGASAKNRAIDDYVNSVEEARNSARQERTQSRAGSRAQSRPPRAESRRREESRGGRARSRARGESSTRYIKPAKRSPASPVPMSPEEIAQASQGQADPATTDDENFYKITSPVDSHKSLRSTRSEKKRVHRPMELRLSAEHDDRGRSHSRGIEEALRSPSLPPPNVLKFMNEEADDISSYGHSREGAKSLNMRLDDDLQARRAASRDQRARSGSRKPTTKAEAAGTFATESSVSYATEDNTSESSSVPMAADAARRRFRGASRKEIAARELEERRMSLARRPSAPAIPLPGVIMFTPASSRPNMSPRSNTDLGDNPATYRPPISRSQTADPDMMNKHNKGKSGTMLPPIGLPATPRAMRHPRYMGTATDLSDRDAPPIPEIPGNASELSSLGGSATGSSLSQVTGSNVSGVTSSNVGSKIGSNSHFGSNISSLQSAGRPPEEADDLGPLLPSTVFGQKAPQGPARSMSAPPEQAMGSNIHRAYNPGLRQSSRGHVRKISPPEAQSIPVPPSGPVSIDEALNTSSEPQIIFIEEEGPAPPVLPELQHLAGPASQPGHKYSSSDVINIAIDNDSHVVEVPVTLPATTFPTTLPATAFPQPMERAATSSPSMHRRGRGSVSETFGSRFKGVADRMRSQSRGGPNMPSAANRTKSPPMPTDPFNGNARPYETVLPPVPGPSHSQSGHSHARRDSLQRAKSPYEQAMAQEQQIPPPPPPPPSPPRPGQDMTRIYETAIPPTGQNLPRSASTTGYRNPKEIRANMPPETLQQGVFGGGFL